MVTVRKSKLLSTSSVIAENTYYYEFDVDTVDELPDPYYNGTIVAHGSKATIINSGEIYRINGDGEWKTQSTSGGGASLPDVTAEDNGDVLTVVEGTWDKATPEKELPEVTSSDNGDVLTVVGGIWTKNSPKMYETFEVEFNGSSPYLANNIKQDIEDCFANNIVPILKTNTPLGYVNFYPMQLSKDGALSRRTFSAFDYGGLLPNTSVGLPFLCRIHYTMNALSTNEMLYGCDRLARYSELPT